MQNESQILVVPLGGNVTSLRVTKGSENKQLLVRGQNIVVNISMFDMLRLFSVSLTPFGATRHFPPRGGTTNIRSTAQGNGGAIVTVNKKHKGFWLLFIQDKELG